MNKMNFSVPNFFSRKWIDTCAAINSISTADTEIVTLFGSIANFPIPSVREDWRLPVVSIKRLKDTTRYAHSKGLAVNFTLNGMCLGSYDDMCQNIKHYRSALFALLDAGVRRVTVSNPWLCELIASQNRVGADRISVTASTVARVRSVTEATMWKNAGADRLCPALEVGRDFSLLKEMNDVIDLELMVNEFCLYNCPWRMFHFAVQTHSKMPAYDDEVMYWPLRNCIPEYTRDGANWLRARAVRPEDLIRYRDKCGIKFFKITGRTAPVSSVERIVRAYMARKLDGNYISLFPGLHRLVDEDDRPAYKEFAIDNSKLTGFIDHFLLGMCHHGDCGSCGYCSRWFDDVHTEVVRVG